MSEDYLSRVFHREFGLSPWDYLLNRLRIQLAKDRLRDSDDTIQMVARRVGFRELPRGPLAVRLCPSAGQGRGIEVG